MKITTLTDKAMSTASKIYFNEKNLGEIAYINEGAWNKKNTTDQEEFEKEGKKNKDLYKKLRKYRDEIFDKCVIAKEINSQEHNLINDKIDSLLDGTYKEKYC